MDSQSSNRVQRTFRAFQHRDFRLFWAGQWISVTGTWMQSTALFWLVYRMTDSPLALGVFNLARFGPSMVGALFAGVIADRFHRHRLVISTQACSLILATVLAFLTLAGHIQVWHILLLSLAQGCVDTLDMTARQTFQMDIVGPEDLQSAVALNSAAFNAGRFVGPLLAGPMIYLWRSGKGEGFCFALNAISYLAVLISLLIIRRRPQIRKSSETSVLKEIREGLRFVWWTRSVRYKVLAIGVTSLIGLSFSTVLPVFAKTVLHGDSRSYGLLGAGSGVGAICGALFAAAGSGKSSGSKNHLFGLIVLGLSLCAIGSTRTLPLAVLWMVVIGMAVSIQLAGTNAFLQTTAPGHLRGRVISIYMWTFTGLTPIGGFMVGWAATHVGVVPTTVVAGALCLASGLVLLAIRDQKR